mmetsp:Transcript_7195/g.21947  ORF Transcript_7195/g.21947 Transcript_7195/m.21947 type:complete len:213 (+) Transcript_7195:42-680(+)
MAESAKEEEEVFRDSVEGGEEDEFEDAVDPATRAMELKEEGNALFRSEKYSEAHAAYTASLEMEGSADVRSAAYSNRAACSAKLGRAQSEIIADCSAALDLRPDYVKALLRRSAAYEAEEHFDEATADLEKVVELDPKARVAKTKLEALEEKRRRRDAELKDEAISKLKDLGNSVLGNFGLSLDNFQLQQTDTGGYNISYNPSSAANPAADD